MIAPVASTLVVNIVPIPSVLTLVINPRVDIPETTSDSAFTFSVFANPAIVTSPNEVEILIKLPAVMLVTIPANRFVPSPIVERPHQNWY